MSEVKVNKISPRSGTDVTLGDSGDNFIIPSGATLTNNGTASGFASIAWQSAIKTASFTAVAGEGYWVNTTSSAITITLPASASVGDQIIFTDYARTWATNAVTVNQNSLNFQGNTSPNPVYNTSGQSVNIVYSGATQGWIPNSDDDVTFETATLYSGDILVVAGGGSDGIANSGTSYGSGGGGAGGYRSFTSETFTQGSVYTITVGAGGTSHANGSNSSISGTGISYTSAGGGSGGNGDNADGNGNAGGSGGGAGAASGAIGGSGNTPATLASQGNDGGTGTDSGNTGAGGGGGAGAVGGNGSTGVGGNGGNGTANSITGSSVTYAGGGGGGAGYGPDGTGGTGGTGGGGNGSGSGQGTAGTANTGGGAGGSEGGTVTAVNGGSGVVILRVATANYSGTTTGSPTVTTDGTDTVIKFTGSGSYTA